MKYVEDVFVVYVAKRTVRVFGWLEASQAEES